MTDERTFDRLARAWLELGPDEAPDRVIAAVLQAAETTPQVRRRFGWPFWRSFHMTRMPIIATTAVAVLVVLVGGGLILNRGGSGPGSLTASPSPSAASSPSPNPSAAASVGTPLPAGLAIEWQGPPRDIPTMGTSTRTRLHFGPTDFNVSGDSYGNGKLSSTASVTGPSTLELVSLGNVACAKGDVGRYHWSLSPKGKILTISADRDACAARAIAIAGTWYTSTACKIDPGGCLGDLEAGTFPTQYIDPRLDPGAQWNPAFGAITYTVPDGWSNSSDWPATFSLTPSIDYAKETKDGVANGATHQIEIFAKPAALGPSCDDTVLSSVPRTVDGLMTHITSSKSVTPSAVHAITVGGHAAKWVDVALASTWTGKCPGDPKVSASLLVQVDDPQKGWGFGLDDRERARIILVDLGSGHTGLIVVDSSDPTRFDQLATDAMPIIRVIHVQVSHLGCGDRIAGRRSRAMGT